MMWALVVGFLLQWNLADASKYREITVSAGAWGHRTGSYEEEGLQRWHEENEESQRLADAADQRRWAEAEEADLQRLADPEDEDELDLRRLQDTTTAAPAADAANAEQTGAVIPGQDNIALAEGRVTTECSKSFVQMYYNKDFQEMNTTVLKNCRVRVENKLQGCCETVRFKEWADKNSEATPKDIVENCASKCSVNCEHFHFAQFCNAYFGRSCTLSRFPMKDLDFEILETFCIPEDCDNDKDRADVVAYFHLRWLRNRRGWRYNYENGELHCDDGSAEKALIAVGAVVAALMAVMLGLFLFKPPAEKKSSSRRPREVKLQS